MSYPTGSPAQYVQAEVGGVLSELQTEATTLKQASDQLVQTLAKYNSNLMADGTTWAQKMPQTMQALQAAQNAFKSACDQMNAVLPAIQSINSQMAEDSGLIA